MLSIRSLTPVLLLSVSVLVHQVQHVHAQEQCGTDNPDSCRFEPFNPLICGDNYACGYDNFCLARANGFDTDADCCQAPQPSMCTFPLFFYGFFY